MGSAGMPLEPFLERRFTALELVEPVVLGERLGAPRRRSLLGCEDARLGEEVLEPGLLQRRTVEKLDEAVPRFGLENERCAIRKHALGLDDSRANDEVGEGRFRGLRRMPDEPVRLGQRGSPSAS